MRYNFHADCGLVTDACKGSDTRNEAQNYPFCNVLEGWIQGFPEGSPTSKGIANLLLPPANGNIARGKVIFSEVCVILFTGGFLFDITFCLVAWSHFPSRGVSVSGPMFLLGGISVQGSLCLGRSLSRVVLSRGVSVNGSLSGGLCLGSLSRPPDRDTPVW